MSGEKRVYGGPEGPYRTAVEIEKEEKLTKFQKFVNWWKKEEHYIPGIMIGIIGALMFGFVCAEIKRISLERKIENHGISVCQQNHYVETKYPAVGLTKIICLSANGEEKNVFEETNK